MYRVCCVLADERPAGTSWPAVRFATDCIGCAALCCAAVQAGVYDSSDANATTWTAFKYTGTGVLLSLTSNMNLTETGLFQVRHKHHAVQLYCCIATLCTMMYGSTGGGPGSQHSTATQLLQGLRGKRLVAMEGAARCPVAPVFFVAQMLAVAVGTAWIWHVAVGR